VSAITIPVLAKNKTPITADKKRFMVLSPPGFELQALKAR
jgi:hypothetical protein